ncbi:Uma2 family endonuclease [Streptomyces hesseae]|uniref:Uma2 family endonuclease n=1 Tax=Streptomyces hesseae TaxID=3075519 RepID=A0ABU2SWQ4_9ACTN|nr:Uma2 family endonuclease [Streptomyces sp. DSM 40473]MDT0453433.1 Uma2 family endonuclease [Streptomyces sp. DSM 40473]
MTTRAAARPQMLVEEFEELAHAAPETVWLEFINGRLEVKPPSDGNRGTIVMWLLEQCMRQRPDLVLYPYRGGLKAEANRDARVRPDGSLAPDGHFVGHGEWSDPEGVLMTVEVTSNDPYTDHLDRVEKLRAYAATGIPVYLLVDRDQRTVTVHAEPERERYCLIVTRSFGARVEIPAPVGIVLKTEKLKDYAD